MRHTIIGFAALVFLLGCDNGGGTDAGPRPDGAPADPVIGLSFEEVEIDGDAFTDIAWIPGRADEFVIASHGGEILHYRIDGTSTTRLGAITVPEVAQMGDCGLLAVALDPDWESNHLIYAGHCIAEDFATRITRLTWDGTDYEVADTAQVVLEVHETRGPHAFNHNISNILFEEGGVMVVGVGDKSAGPEVGQDPTSLPSTIMRIIPNREPEGSGYTPAPGNPFEDPTVGAPEVWAYGFRYPWRIVRDPRGWYYVGDVGGGAFEEVNVVLEAGQNFGWRECEGPCMPPRAGLTDPITAWPHDDDHPYVAEDPETLPGPRRVVWLAPSPPATAPDHFEGLLDDTLLFGDVCTGWVRGATIDDEGEMVDDRLLAHLPFVTAWTWSPDGVGYVTTFGSCDALVPLEPAKLFRVVPRR